MSPFVPVNAGPFESLTETIRWFGFDWTGSGWTVSWTKLAILILGGTLVYLWATPYLCGQLRSSRLRRV